MSTAEVNAGLWCFTVDIHISSKLCDEFARVETLRIALSATIPEKNIVTPITSQSPILDINQSKKIRILKEADYHVNFRVVNSKPYLYKSHCFLFSEFHFSFAQIFIEI